VRGDADPVAAAAMLLGACFQRAFLRHFLAEDLVPPEGDHFAQEVVRGLMLALFPSEEHKGLGTAIRSSNDRR
jgi:hypothetical protein